MSTQIIDKKTLEEELMGINCKIESMEKDCLILDKVEFLSIKCKNLLNRKAELKQKLNNYNNATSTEHTYM